MRPRKDRKLAASPFHALIIPDYRFGGSIGWGRRFAYSRLRKSIPSACKAVRCRETHKSRALATSDGTPPGRGVCGDRLPEHGRLCYTALVAGSMLPGRMQGSRPRVSCVAQTGEYRESNNDVRPPVRNPEFAIVKPRSTIVLLAFPHPSRRRTETNIRTIHAPEWMGHTAIHNPQSAIDLRASDESRRGSGARLGRG